MKRISLAAFIGVAGLLLITLGVGTAGSTPAGSATLTGTSATPSNGLDAVTSAHSGASAGPPTPRRVGHGPMVPRGAKRIGALGTSTRINVDVALAPSNPAALEDYAANISSPGNSLYHHYLTVGQFASMFGPTAAAISTVEASLRADGLTPGPLSANHLTLPVTATANQFAKAFSIGFDSYRLSSGRTAFANTAAPLFQGAAAQYISSVVGLDTLSTPQPVGPPTSAEHLSAQESPQVVTGGPQPCPTLMDAASGTGSYTDDQIASAYNFSGLYGAGDEGAGVTVALLELEPNLASDIAGYQACYGTNASVTDISVDGGVGAGGGSGEAALDIETVIGLAPKAAIDVYQAPPTNTAWIDDITAMVDASAVNVMSISYGGCESAVGTALIDQEYPLFEQAAIEGKSVFVASGDDGSAACGRGTSALDVDDPADQPWVTSVGGTSLTSVSPLTQITWNNSALGAVQGAGAGGGGVSPFPMPLYQSSAPAALNVINPESSGSPCDASSGSYCREVPDVSASADGLHGYVIAIDGVWLPEVGGTSAAAPLWAAFAALADASSACAGTAIGFANPLLYRAAATHYAADFADITSGTNDFTPDGYTGGLYNAATGYDMATGLGTPNGATLAQALCSSAANPVAVTNPGSQAMTVGTAVSLPVTATDSREDSLTFSAAGLPPGLSISPSGLISGSPTAAGSYSVTVTATDTTGASGSAAFSVTVGQAAQSITFSPPTSGTVGGSATLSATGGGSANPVVFSVDASSGPGVCTVSGANGATVNYAAAGSCVIDANQAGGAGYTAAPTVTQTITVGQAGPASQSIVFIPPATGTVGGSAVLSATGGGSGNPVVFSVDGSSGSGVCSVSGSTVSYLAAGSCVIDANQAGNASYTAAQAVTKTITVDQGPAFVTDSPPLTAVVGQPYDYTFTASGTPAPAYALASGAPSWLSVDASTGEVTGTPPSCTTSFSYAVTATDPAGTSTAGPFTVTVSTASSSAGRADLSAALSCPASMTVDGTGTCTLTVANAGPGTASTVEAGVRLPFALSEVSCTSDCGVHANVFTWTLTGLASGDSAQFAVTVKASAAGRARVLAAAISQNCDPNPRNNISVQQVTIEGQQGGQVPGPGRHPGRGDRGWPTRRRGR